MLMHSMTMHYKKPRQERLHGVALTSHNARTGVAFAPQHHRTLGSPPPVPPPSPDDPPPFSSSTCSRGCARVHTQRSTSRACSRASITWPRLPDAAPAARGVYKPRRPQASPLFRLVSDHLQRVQTVYDERFAREYGPWRPVGAQVADKLLACGVLDRGFARIRCDDCAHEYLLAFSCKCRYFCPSCHAKRLTIWTQWLDTTLLAPVPHRQVVLTIPKRLRAYCLYRRLTLPPTKPMMTNPESEKKATDRAFGSNSMGMGERESSAL
jgi:hypothetical protein